MTRGGVTASIPITGTRDSSPPMPSSPPATLTSSPDQGLAPHRPSALLLWEADEPNHVEDVSGFAETKIAALLAHESQFESTMGIDDGASAEVDAFALRVRTQLKEHGALVGLAEGESFHLVTDI